MISQHISHDIWYDIIDLWYHTQPGYDSVHSHGDIIQQKYDVWCHRCIIDFQNVCYHRQGNTMINDFNLKLWHHIWYHIAQPSRWGIFGPPADSWFRLGTLRLNPERDSDPLQRSSQNPVYNSGLNMLELSITWSHHDFQKSRTARCYTQNGCT
jgi:hypothetical protein